MVSNVLAAQTPHKAQYSRHRGRSVRSDTSTPRAPTRVSVNAISAKSTHIRAAQQLSILACLPTAAATSLIAFDAIHATVRLAIALGAALLLANRMAGGSSPRRSIASAC